MWTKYLYTKSFVKSSFTTKMQNKNISYLRVCFLRIVIEIEQERVDSIDSRRNIFYRILSGRY